MTASVLYALGTLLTWAGYVFVLRTFYLALKSELRGAIVAALIAGLSLFVGSEVTVAKNLQVPLVWPIMPFTAWVVLIGSLFGLTRCIQAAGALYPDKKQERIKGAIAWLILAVACAFLYRLDPDARIDIVRGAIPLSKSTLLSLLSLAFAATALMVYSARAAKLRGYTKAVITHLALITGSLLFGLPLAWLVITSFKEDRDMSSPNGIVWIPRVQETVPYYDKTNPLYEARYGGTDVEGRIIERHPDGSVKLDINRPLSMRGTTAELQISKLKEIPTEAKLVTVEMDGQAVKGKVIEELADGHERVEAMSPARFAGRQQIYAPAEATPLRRVGLRVANYPEALEYLPPEANRGLTYVQNTITIVVLGMFGTIFVSALVAYAFSRLRFPGRDALFTIMLATMMLPGAVTKLPQFMIFKQLGWIDTLYPLWVPAFFGSAIYIFMLRQFFRQIPMELEDAAKIDGATYVRTFWSVMLPQIKPAIAVIAILTFVATWNNFLDPLIYINSPEHMTISYAVQLYAADRATEPGLLTAFTTMSMVPVLLLFFFAQRYFIEGVTLTGMGGR